MLFLEQVLLACRQLQGPIKGRELSHGKWVCLRRLEQLLMVITVSHAIHQSPGVELQVNSVGTRSCRLVIDTLNFASGTARDSSQIATVIRTQKH